MKVSASTHPSPVAQAKRKEDEEAMWDDETGCTSPHSLDSSISLLDTSDEVMTPEDGPMKRRMRPPLPREDVLIKQHLQFLQMPFDNDASQDGVGWTESDRAQARIDTWATLVKHDPLRVVAAARDYPDLVKKGDTAMEWITKMHQDPNKEANDLSPIADTDKGMNADAWRKMINTRVRLMSAKHPLDAPDYQSKVRLQAMQGMQHQQPQQQHQQGLQQRQENQRQHTAQQQQQQQQQQQTSAHQEVQQAQAVDQQQQQHTEQATATQGGTEGSK